MSAISLSMIVLLLLDGWGGSGILGARAGGTSDLSENVRVTLDGEKMAVHTKTTELTIKEQNQLARLFLTLHTELYRLKVLPRRGVFSGMKVLDDGSKVVDPCFPRDSIKAFLQNVSSVIPDGSRCLEWGEYYTKQIPQCTDRWKFTYEASNPHVDHENRIIHALIDAPLPKAVQEVVGTFDAVVCTQVYEHIRYPHIASKVISSLLKSGGHVFWTAPFMEPRHLVPQDHYRYTLDAGKKLFEDVGLQFRQGFVGGNAYLTSARILGYTKLDIAEVNNESLQDTIIDSRDYFSRRLPMQQDLYWGSYLVARKPNTLSSGDH